MLWETGGGNSQGVTYFARDTILARDTIFVATVLAKTVAPKNLLT